MTECRDLVVYDEGMDLESSTLEVMVKRLSEEAQLLEQQYEAEIQQALILTADFDRDPAVFALLRQVIRLTRELGALTGVPEDQRPPDPTPPRDFDPNPQIKEIVQALAKTNDPRLFELRRKCRKIFLKLSILTHPDKVKDENLNELFAIIKDAYDRLDLKALRMIAKDILDYKELTKSNKKRKNALYETKIEMEIRVRQAKERIATLKDQLSYRVLLLQRDGKVDEAKAVYRKFLEDRADQLRMQKAALRTGMNLHPEGDVFRATL